MRLAIIAGGLIAALGAAALVRGCGRRGLVWTYRPVAHGVPRLCADDGQVYVAWANGVLKSLSLHTGKALGLIDFARPFPFQGIPAVVGKQLIIGADDCHIRAIATDTGQQVWDYQTGGAVRAQPAVDNGEVLVGSDDGWLYCLDLATGQGLWRVNCGGPIGARAAVTAERVVVGTVAGKIVGIDRIRHCVAWSKGTEGPVLAPAVVVDDDLVTVGCDDGKQYMLQVQSGEKQVIAAVDGLIRREPVVDGQRLYVAGNNGEVLAVDLQSHQILWKHTVGTHLTSGLAATGSYLYAGTDTGRIIALHKDKGAVRYSWRVGEPVTGSLIVKEGLVVAGLSDGNVVALSAPKK